MMCGTSVSWVVKSRNFKGLICIIFNYEGVHLCACKYRCLQN